MRVNPFDIRTVVLAKHAQHVVLIHFPLALFIAAVAFDYLAQWTRNQALAAAAYFNLLLAAISTMPAIATGFAAWQWALEGADAEGHSAAAPGPGLRLERFHLARQLDPLAGAPASCGEAAELSAANRNGRILLVALTGHLGGFLSGVNAP